MSVRDVEYVDSDTGEVHKTYEAIWVDYNDLETDQEEIITRVIPLIRDAATFLLDPRGSTAFDQERLLREHEASFAA